MQITLCPPGKLAQAVEKTPGQGEPSGAQPPQAELLWAETRAILDTGATNTAVSKRLAERLQLVPSGKTKVLTAAGQREVNTYQVDVLLPFGSTVVPIERLPITEYDAPRDDVEPQVLLGMDVIQRGCLTVDFQGKWTFSL